jgi:hypothetical protein
MKNRVMGVLLLMLSSSHALGEETKPAVSYSPNFKPGECVATCEKPKGEFLFKVYSREEIETQKIKRPKKREALVCEPKVQAIFTDGCDVCHLFCNPNQ